MCFPPLFILELCCYPILTSLGIDSEVAGHAARFSFFLFIAICFHMQFDCYRQYLNATNNSKVVQYAVSSTILVVITLVFPAMFPPTMITAPTSAIARPKAITMA